MRTRILVVLLILGGGFLIGCNNNDTTSEEVLDGVWNLKNVRGGLQGINLDYPLGDVIWDFNFETNNLIIENNIMTTGPEDIYAGLDSGIYDFEVIQSEDVQTLYIDNNERGVILLSDNKLIVDGGIALDGTLAEFER